MRYYVDPPTGWRYGFPRVWDDEECTLDEFLHKHGVPVADREWVRMWYYEQQDNESSAGS